MIRHCLRLIWNRKRTNFLVTLEIFFSFLVVAAVLVMGSHYLGLYRSPLGFTIDDVLVVQIDTKNPHIRPTPELHSATVEQLRLVDAAVKEFPEAVSTARGFTAPYVRSQWIDDFEQNGRRISYGLNEVTDDYNRVFGIRLTRGRWFSAEDDAAATITPTVINERFAVVAFGTADPLGKVIRQDAGRDGRRPPERRVIGVIDEFRQMGDFTVPDNYAFTRHQPESPDSGVLTTLLVKVRPGTTAAFEERLARRLQDVARGWSFEIRPLEELRRESRMEAIGPLLAFGIIAAFLLLMVGLGLTGVMWQTVTQRTREMGLRRANGAAARQVRSQIMLELTLMTSLAVLAGVAVVVQVPMLELIGGVSGAAYVAGLAISAAAIYLLTILCGWYPSRLASQIPPAEALRYE
jgi:putative ABC transport system permease protein